MVVDGLVSELAQVIEHYPDTDLFCFNSSAYREDKPEITWPKVRHGLFGIQRPQDVLLGLLQNGSYTSAAWNYVVKKASSSSISYVLSIVFMKTIILRYRCL